MQMIKRTSLSLLMLLVVVLTLSLVSFAGAVPVSIITDAESYDAGDRVQISITPTTDRVIEVYRGDITEEGSNLVKLISSTTRGGTYSFLLPSSWSAGVYSIEVASQNKTFVVNEPSVLTPPQPAPKYVYLTIYGSDSIIENNKRLRYSSGMTAYSILGSAGVSTSGSSDYVTGIGSDQAGDHGPMSGWMYQVNGSAPNVPAGDYDLSSDDKVTWFYTEDGFNMMYTPSGSHEAITEEVVVDPEPVQVTLAGLEPSRPVVVESAFANVTLDPEGLKDFMTAEDLDDLLIDIEEDAPGTPQFTLVSGEEVLSTLSISVTSGDTDIHEGFGSIKITWQAPENVTVKELAILHTKADGSLEIIYPTEDADGNLTFIVNSLSIFASVKKSSLDISAIYPDLDQEAWYFTSIREAFDRGLMVGTSHHTFEPSTNMSRAMLVSVLYRLADPDSDLEADSEFTDVSKDAWYADSVAWAKEAGIVDGYGNGTFGPDDSLSREQLVTIFSRYAAYSEMSTITEDDQVLEPYTDSPNISPWAVDSFKWAVEMGIINGTGDNHLSPEKHARRSEVASILSRFMAQ